MNEVNVLTFVETLSKIHYSEITSIGNGVDAIYSSLMDIEC